MTVSKKQNNEGFTMMVKTATFSGKNLPQKRDMSKC